MIKGMELDWQLVSEPIISSKSMDFSMKGLVYPKNSSHMELDYEPAALPRHREWADSSLKGLQVFVSNYAIDSYIRTYVFGKKGMHLNLTHMDIPTGSEVQLETNSLEQYLPGIQNKFGNNKNMQLYINLPTLNKPLFDKESGMYNYQGSMNMQLLSEKGNLTLDLNLPSFEIQFQLKIQNGQIYPIASDFVPNEIKNP